jgi:tetratricopeptide (TPR) repeat protein
MAACDPNAEIQLDENDLKGLPERFRDLFRFNLMIGIFELNPSAIAQMPALAAEFRRNRALHTLRIVAMIHAGTKKALDVVLAAQPRYAAQQAAWHNHLGARYHIVWALARKPEMLGSLYAEPGLDFMFSFLDSLENVEHCDPGFCARMDALGQLIYTDLGEAWKSLEQSPVSVRAHPLFQLRQAMAYGADEDYERALPLYVELCKRWPDDAVGFANACDCLIHLREWGKAEALLNLAPPSYQRFHLYHCQRENLKQRNLVCSAPRTVPFRGQPDLGGLLRPSQPLKSQPLTVSTFGKTELLARAAKTTCDCLVETDGDIRVALGDTNGAIAL